MGRLGEAKTRARRGKVTAAAADMLLARSRPSLIEAVGEVVARMPVDELLTAYALRPLKTDSYRVRTRKTDALAALVFHSLRLQLKVHRRPQPRRRPTAEEALSSLPGMEVAP